MRKQSRHDREVDMIIMTVLCATFGLIFTAFDAWMIAVGRSGQGFYIYPVAFFIFAGLFLFLMHKERVPAAPVRKRPPLGPIPD